MDRLTSMRVFQKVIEHEGFAAAARVLDMSPASVTRLVSDLEQHLGARLMNRTTRKLVLTDAGHTYLQRVHHILSDIEGAEATVSQHAEELQGTVNVVASPLIAHHFAANQINAWCAKYPKVTLNLDIEPFPQKRIEDFDAAFISISEGSNADVVARLIAKTNYILCASPSYLARMGIPDQPNDLVKHHYLRFLDRGHPGVASPNIGLTHIDRKSEEVEAPIQVVFQTASYECLFAAAADGAGIAALPSFPARKYFETGKLVHLLPRWVFGRYELYVALPSRKYIPARTRAFIDFAVESYAPMHTDPTTKTSCH